MFLFSECWERGGRLRGKEFREIERMWERERRKPILKAVQTGHFLNSPFATAA